MLDRDSRIEIFRGRLNQKADVKKTGFSRLLEFGKAATGPISLLVSAITAYYAAFHFVDDVRAIVHKTPAIELSAGGITTTGALSVSVMNGGTRSIIITRVGITFSKLVSVRAQAELTTCSGPSTTNSTAYYAFDAQVLKAGDSVVINVAERLTPQTDPQLMKRDYDKFWEPFLATPGKLVATEGQKILVCVAIEGDIEQRADIWEHRSWTSMEANGAYYDSDQ